jgi:hypothetical protein
MPKIQVDTKWVHIILVTEWIVSHEIKKYILTKDVVGFLLGEAVSTKKNTSSQRMWLACSWER